MPLFKKFGFQVGLSGSNDFVRLRDRVSKVQLPLLHRPRALPLLSIRSVLVPVAVVEPIQPHIEPSIEQIINKETAKDALRSPSMVDLSLNENKENDNPEIPKTPKRDENARASFCSQPLKYHDNSNEASQPGTQIPLIPVVPLNELKYQGTPARPSNHQTGDLREIPNTRNSVLIGRARAPSNATPDIKWRNATRFLHEQQDEVMEEKKPSERTISRIPSLRRANSKGSQRSTKPSKLSQKSSIRGYVWRDSKPGMAAALAESQKPFKKPSHHQRDLRKAFNRRSFSNVSPDSLSSTVGPPASGISRAQSVPGRSSPKIDPRTGLTLPRQVRKSTPSPEKLSPTSHPPFPLRRKGTRIRANTVDDHENPFATINNRKSQPPSPPENTPNTTPATKSAPEVPVGEVAIFCDNFEPVDIEDADYDGYEGDDDIPLENTGKGETKKAANEEQDNKEHQQDALGGDKDQVLDVEVESNQQLKKEDEITNDLDKFKRKELSPQLLADEAFLRDISSTLSLVNMGSSICESNEDEGVELIPMQPGVKDIEDVVEVVETGAEQPEGNDKQDKGEKEKVKKTVTFKEPEVEWVTTGSETASVAE